MLLFSFFFQHRWMQAKGLGSGARKLVGAFSSIRSLDVGVPVKRQERGAHLHLRTVGKPDPDLALLLAHLGPQLPKGSKIVKMKWRKTPKNRRMRLKIIQTLFQIAELELGNLLPEIPRGALSTDHMGVWAKRLQEAKRIVGHGAELSPRETEMFSENCDVLRKVGLELELRNSIPLEIDEARQW